jgi:hypothetical protein
MTFDLSIAGEHLRLRSSPEVLKAIKLRFGAFEHGAGSSASSPGPFPAPIELQVHRKPGDFSPQYETPVEVMTRASRGGEIVFEGPVRGSYSPMDRRGIVQDVAGLGAVDVLVRTALSIALPLGGAVLLHGAALFGEDGMGVALCGASGSGKSTAAAAFGAHSDEHVVLRPTAAGLDLESTPYWGGRPHRDRCGGVVCLQRGGVPRYERLRGATIVRVLAPHVVRYVALDRVDRAILATLGAIAERASVTLASCPEGEAFLPFLGEKNGFRSRVA